MNYDTLIKEQADAILKRIQHETIEVTMTKTNLKFSIDDRHPLPKEWLRELIRIDAPFIMVNKLNGEVMHRRDAHDNIASNVVQAD